MAIDKEMTARDGVPLRYHRVESLYSHTNSQTRIEVGTRDVVTHSVHAAHIALQHHDGARRRVSHIGRKSHVTNTVDAVYTPAQHRPLVGREARDGSYPLQRGTPRR